MSRRYRKSRRDPGLLEIAITPDWKVAAAMAAVCAQINPLQGKCRKGHKPELRRYIIKMRIEGILSKWNDDRGFGFITPTQGGQEIFVHISTFPKDGVRPKLGEKLSFEIETDNTGKKRAKNLLRAERSSAARTATTAPRRAAPYQRRERPGIFSRAVPLLIVLGLIGYGYSEYSQRTNPLTASVAKQEMQQFSQTYRCDGRKHCSQMTSCAEATFFLRNCPNVQMDGNNDGVPCEQQWCTSPFAE